MTADLESHVVVVELRGGRVLREVRDRAGAAQHRERGRDERGRGAHAERDRERPRRAVASAAGAAARVPGAALHRRRPRRPLRLRDGFGPAATSRAWTSCAARCVERLALGGPARHVTLARRAAAVGGARLEGGGGRGRRRRPGTGCGSSRACGRRFSLTTSVSRRTVETCGSPRATAATIAVYDCARGELRFTHRGGRAAAARHVHRRPRLRRERRRRQLPRARRSATAGCCETTRVPVGSYNVQQGSGCAADAVARARDALRAAAGAGGCCTELHVARSSHDACLVMDR